MVHLSCCHNSQPALPSVEIRLVCRTHHPNVPHCALSAEHVRVMRAKTFDRYEYEAEDAAHAGHTLSVDCNLAGSWKHSDLGAPDPRCLWICYATDTD
jgi:hypothetical protein